MKRFPRACIDHIVTTTSNHSLLLIDFSESQPRDIANFFALSQCGVEVESLKTRLTTTGSRQWQKGAL